MTTRIAVVDDSLTVRMNLCEAFEEAGYQTVPCVDLSEARSALNGGGVDLLVLDVVLPDGDGVDLLTEIRSQPTRSRIPVILLSAESEIESRLRGRSVGADEYIGKPYDPAHVVSRARELLREPFVRPPRSRVLIIDDSLTFCQELRRHLEEGGFAVQAAGTGEEGLRKAAEFLPNAIIIDGVLPGIDGAEVLRRIRLDPALQRTACLFLTASESSADEVTALETGADVFLRKEEGAKAVLGRLAALLRSTDGRSPGPQSSALEGQRLLLVSGEQDLVEWVTPILRDQGHDVAVAESEERALSLLALELTDCILFEEAASRDNVVNSCKRLKNSALLRHIPLIVLAHANQRVLLTEALEAGADDWIATASVTPDLLRARVSAWLRRKDFEDHDRRIREELATRARELERVTDELKIYKQLLDRMPTGVTVAEWEDTGDADSLRVLWENPLTERLRDTGGCGVVGRPFPEVFPELFAAGGTQKLRDAIGSGSPVRIPRVPWNSGSGARTVDVTAVPLTNRRIGVLTQDVTAQVQAEEEREVMERQMRAAQRMEAVGQLAGGIAHDFNNVLTIIQSYGQLLRENFSEGEPAREDADTILQAVDRAARLTNQLLAFSRRQPQNLAVIAVNDELRALDKMLQRILREDVDLETRLADDVGNVKADPSQIEQVVLNLAVNARDAMPGGGKLTIETSNVELDTDYGDTKPAEVPPGRYVMIAATDSGHGMDPDTRSKIFEPFFTTKEKEKGTGLGLATVYGIVKQNRGFIWVYSEPGRGTTFKIYLPRVDEKPRAEGPAEARPAQLGGEETILLVEDDEMVRKAARRILERRGYTVLPASSGTRALELIREHGRSIELVLTDVVMPDMGGRELVEQLSAEHPGMKAVYISGYTQSGSVRNGAVEEGAGFVQKPFSPDSLLSAVRLALDEG